MTPAGDPSGTDPGPRPAAPHDARDDSLTTLVTRVEAAGVLGIHERTWSVWIREGRAPEPVRVPTPSAPPRTMYRLGDLLRLRAEIEARHQPYPDPERPGVYRLPLRSNTPAGNPMEALIDADALPLVRGRFWIWEKPDRRGYKTGWVMLSATVGPNTQLKRLVLGVDGTDLCVVHLNGDPLDCRRANLAAQTTEEQHYRSRKKGAVSGREYTSRHKGVSWCEDRGKWKAQIQKDRRNRLIGRFDDEAEAAAAYDRAARELFGEHALLNFGEVLPVGCRAA